MLSSSTAGILLAPPQRDAAIGTRKVVVLLASAESNAALRAWAEAVGFDLGTDYDGNPRDASRFDFHVTLLATVDPASIPETEHAIDPITVYAEGFKVLGQDRQVPCLAIDVEADDFNVVAAMRRHFIETYDAEPTFADFVPHVSLSYAWDGETPSLADIEVPAMLPIVLDRLRVKPLDDKPKAAAIKSREPQLAPVDTSAFAAAVAALTAQYAAWGAVVDRYSELLEEYYTSTEDPGRVREIIAEVGRFGPTVAQFAAANQPLVDAVHNAAGDISSAIDDQVSDITSFYDLDYEQDYISPGSMIEDMASEIEEMQRWLAGEGAAAASSDDEPKSRKRRGLGRKSRQRKSFLAGFDQSIVDALMQAEGGADLWATYQDVARQIDIVDSQLSELNAQMISAEASAMTSLEEMEVDSGMRPTPQERWHVFAEFDKLKHQNDLLLRDKSDLLEEASRIEAEMLKLVAP